MTWAIILIGWWQVFAEQLSEVRTKLLSSSDKESQTDGLLISVHVLLKEKTYLQKATGALTTEWKSDCQTVLLNIWRQRFAAAVELFGGSLQIVVVVLASLHCSLLEAFDLLYTI